MGDDGKVERRPDVRSTDPSGVPPTGMKGAPGGGLKQMKGQRVMGKLD